MQEQLMQRLHSHLVNNHLDLLISLQQEGRVTVWLQERVTGISGVLQALQQEGLPAYIIEERCMDEITSSLGPSRFNYIAAILEEDFAEKYQQLKESGTLTYEVINLIHACTSVFAAISLTDGSEDDNMIRYAVTGTIQEYFTEQTVTV